MSLSPTASNLTVSGVTIPGGTLRGAHDITIANTTFTDTLNIVSTVPNANILIDHDVFNNISPCGSCPEGRVTVTTEGSKPPGPSGVTISNSVFSGGTSDGVQITGNANGVVVGPGQRVLQPGPVELRAHGLDPALRGQRHHDHRQLHPRRGRGHHGPGRRGLGLPAHREQRLLAHRPAGRLPRLQARARAQPQHVLRGRDAPRRPDQGRQPDGRRRSSRTTSCSTASPSRT